eukprot:Plantae.Rhodophyta-Purpureofilum_apyrenoidigerum.ctg26174.p3 GENE.Plantae.Rhodophyta-Purpureofilum_apyrenoidigerum.ctg26174~~Plantae.Rhodophyta-Purpureofilum_apyrenoidigerum.ctg26174.p3  ORF type:complete len:148 (-),score=11.14 Plantae.Rhodophyta-Purpureofilum_apyrenoidigerum.ctg26174:341-784(-)
MSSQWRCWFFRLGRRSASGVGVVATLLLFSEEVLHGVEKVICGELLILVARKPCLENSAAVDAHRHDDGLEALNLCSLVVRDSNDGRFCKMPTAKLAFRGRRSAAGWMSAAHALAQQDLFEEGEKRGGWRKKRRVHSETKGTRTMRA